MRDAKDLLKPLDQLEPPELWREASTRAPSVDHQSPAGRVATRVVAGVIAIAAMAILIRAFGDGRRSVQPADNVANGKIAVAREACEGGSFLCREPARIVLVNADGSDERDIAEGSTLRGRRTAPAWPSPQAMWRRSTSRTLTGRARPR